MSEMPFFTEPNTRYDRFFTTFKDKYSDYVVSFEFDEEDYVTDFSYTRSENSYTKIDGDISCPVTVKVNY